MKIIADNVIAKLINSKASLHPEEHLQNFTPVTLEKILFSEKFTVNKWGCAKPLHIGSWKRKLIKSILYFPVVALYKVGYNIGGIYAICRKNEE
ncbi:MAG: hypothetical protein GX640_05280 [Fibrobacter sp.]|nr:hypothetical protein [Fibrobacter sp.]